MKLLIVGHKFKTASTGTRVDGSTYQTGASVELHCLRKMIDPSYSGFTTKIFTIKDNNPFFAEIQNRIGTGIEGLYIDVDFNTNVINNQKFETVAELEILSSTPPCKVVTDKPIAK